MAETTSEALRRICDDSQSERQVIDLVERLGAARVIQIAIERANIKRDMAKRIYDKAEAEAQAASRAAASTAQQGEG